jgi:hypothetical protein
MGDYYSDNAKLTSLVVVWALWPHYALRISGCVESQCCTTCLGESKFVVYKYEFLTYLDVYQAALTWRRTPKHACLQIVLHFGVVEHSVELLMVTIIARMQSSLPLWLFEHSGPITLCVCLEASIYLRVVPYRILHGGAMIWLLSSSGENNILRTSAASAWVKRCF